MHHQTRIVMCVAFLFAWLLLTSHLQAADLQQVNPIRKAPDVINTPDPDISDAYPWFSNDGKLFLFTREDNRGFNPPTSGGPAELYISYLKNRPQIVSTPAGETNTLPALDVATPWRVPVPEINNGETVKAIAYCEDDPGQPDYLATRGQYRYRFALFFSRGPEAGDKEMFRAWRLKVFIDEQTLEIVDVQLGGQVRLMGSGVNVDNHNMTEPMLTSDGQYLFWASNAFAGGQAKFIHTTSRCAMLDQASQPYEDLPRSRFAWVDQYVDVSADPYYLISRTNYHTVLERASDGKTALIFERCHAQKTTGCSYDEQNHTCSCPVPNSTYCQCRLAYGSLQTMGFTAKGVSGGPEKIQRCCEPKELNRYGVRYTHPAISGPQNPDGSWLLFFMRGKKIWYTKIKE